MKAPRNEREFNAQAQPVQRCGVKFAGACRPVNRRIAVPARKNRLSLWQRIRRWLA